MKKINIKTLCMGLLIVATSCDDLTSVNNNPKAYQSGTVPEGAFFANATRNVTDAVVYGFSFKLWAQQFAETTYFTTSNYTLTDPGNGFWVTLYRDVLTDYKEARKILMENPSVYPGVDQNKLAMIQIMEVYAYATLVDTFGDIPYADAIDTSLKAEALDPDNTTPAYDDATAIYEDLFTKLNNAIAALEPEVENGGGASAFGDSDIIYHDDVEAWIKLANSLKLRMAMTISDVNPTKAKQLVESIDEDDLFTSSADNAELAYLATTPNTNPIWVGLIQSGRQDYVASNTMVDLMQTPDAVDPRLAEYYTVDENDAYSGGKYGAGNSFATFSKAGAKVTSTTWPGILLDYVEVEFLLAEAAVKGFTVSGTVESHYNSGILASIDYWGGDAGAATTYLADPDVAFATAMGSTDLEKVITQKYIAMFNRGFEGWVDYRRFDYPSLNVPPNPGGPFPIRYSYPNAEQTSNNQNYTAAASAIGGDLLTTKIFWDVE